MCFYCLFCFFYSPVLIAFKFFLFYFTPIPNNSLLLVYYFLSFLLRLYICYNTIAIPNPTEHPSLVLIHFVIFLSFLTVGVNVIFSHTTPSFYSLLSLFLLHLTSHKHSSFLSQLTFFLPSYKRLISFPPFINSI